MILATYTKQPADVLDYDIDYVEWLASGDTIDSATATATPDDDSFEILEPLVIVTGTRVKVWTRGGLNVSTYKVEVTTTTTGGRTKQDEFRVRVKEY